MYTMEYHSATKKNGVMPFITTWMKLETVILSEVRQREKEKRCMTSLVIPYTRNLKRNYTNGLTYKTETDS